MDTNGEGTLYSYTRGEVISSMDKREGVVPTSTHMERAQEEFTSCRRRIDENTKQQREYAGMVAELKHKVEDYRRRAADVRSLSPRVVTDELPSLDLKTIDRYRDETWLHEKKLSEEYFEVNSRFEDERRRNEEYRVQLDQERLRNEQLQREMDRMRLDSEASVRETEKMFQSRDKGLVQYMGEESQRVNELMTELQRMKKQLSHFNEKTSQALDSQKSEFLQVLRQLGGRQQLKDADGREITIKELLGEGDTAVDLTKDSVLIEAIRRFRDLKRPLVGDEVLGEKRVSGSDYAEINTELMQKYEECVEKNVELEAKVSDNQRKNVSLETELQDFKKRLLECQNALRKVHDISTSSERADRERMGEPEGERKEREETPETMAGNAIIPPSEVIRVVRSVFRNKDTEIQQLTHNIKVLEAQVADLTAKFETSEAARKRSDDQLYGARKEMETLQTSVDESKRVIRRLEDQIKARETEKQAIDEACKRLEDELHRLQAEFQALATEGEKKLRAEAEQRVLDLEESYKKRIVDFNNRIDNLQKENRKLRAESDERNNRARELETENKTLVRKIEEKAIVIKELENARTTLMKEIEQQRLRYDTAMADIDHLNEDLNTARSAISSAEVTMKDMKAQRDDISKQKDDLTQQLFDVKQKLDAEKAGKVDLDKTNRKNEDEIRKLHEQITRFEQEIVVLRKQTSELEAQVTAAQAKITGYQTDASSNQKEIQRLTTVIETVQKEKQIIISQKRDVDSDVTSFKEQIQKFKTKLETISNENKALKDSEDNLKDTLSQQTTKISTLLKQLEDERRTVKSFEDQIADLQGQNVIRLEREVGLGADATDEKSRGDTTIIKQDVKTITLQTELKELTDKLKIANRKLEDERTTLEDRIRGLEADIRDKTRTITEKDTDIEDLRRKNNDDLNKFHDDISALNDRHLIELEEERDRCNREVANVKKVESDVRLKLTTTDTKLKEITNKLDDLQKELTDWQDKYKTASIALQKLQDDSDDARSAADKEIQKWKNDAYSARSELTTLETTSSVLKSQLAGANDRCSELNKTVNEYTIKIRDLESQAHRLEEELSDLKLNADQREKDIENAYARLRTTEENYSTLQTEYNKMKNELDNLKRDDDLLKGKYTASQTEIERLQKKITLIEVSLRELKTALENAEGDRERLRDAYREKVKELEKLTQFSQTFDARMKKMREEVENAKDKLMESERDRVVLRNETNKLTNEVKFLKDQLARKNDEYKAALEELANHHRTAEDGRIKALEELGLRKSELSDVQSRLDVTERRLMMLQQEFITVDSERDALAEALRRFQSLVNRVLLISRTKIEEGLGETLDQTTDSLSIVRTEGTASLGPAAGGPVDIKQLEDTLQTLIARINKLERERSDYVDELSHLKRRTSDTHLTINRYQTQYKSIEDNLAGLSEDNRALEARLQSAKQLLRSQEEALKQRDEERRQLKSKVVTIELEGRGKDAQLRRLNEEVKNIRRDLENSQNEIRTLRNREEALDATKFKLESKLREKDNETQTLNIALARFEAEKQNLNDRLKDLDAQLKLRENQCAEMTKETDRIKREISKKETTEVKLITPDPNMKTAAEYQAINLQLTRSQTELLNANSRKQQLEDELTTIRLELRDTKMRMHDSENRVSELQRQIQDLQLEKNRLDDKAQGLERIIATHRLTENELRQQLASTVTEKAAAQKDLDDLHKKLAGLEVAKRNVDEQFSETCRERFALVKRIEILETEKRRADVAISETVRQREAIEKSLGAMEKENRELYRSCDQLRQQISQLEIEHENRLSEFARQRDEQERYVQKVRNEKSQMARMVENSERNQMSRIKQLESQLALTKDQLDAERRRGHEFVDKAFKTTTAGVGAARAGRSAYFSSLAGGIGDSYDYMHRSSQVMRSSYGSTSMPADVTGTTFGMASSTASIGGQEISREMMTSISSKQSSVVGSISESGKGDSGLAQKVSTAVKAEKVSEPVTVELKP